MKPVYRVRSSGDPSVRAVAPAINSNADALLELQEIVGRQAREIAELRDGPKPRKPSAPPENPSNRRRKS